jgi:hypothetical protein
MAAPTINRIGAKLKNLVLGSEVQNKMIFMGHQILSCHVPAVWSFFIYFKIISSS